MDSLLTAVKTVSHNDQPSLVNTSVSRNDHVENHASVPKSRSDIDPTSADHILGVLKSKPDRDDLFYMLTILDPLNKEITTRQFDIRLPSPTTAQILHVLVSTTIPDHWDSLKVKSKDFRSRDAKVKAALLRCLSSVGGVSSLVAQLRTLITASRSSSQHAEGSSSPLQIMDILAVLAALLKPTDFLFRLHTDISTVYDNETKKQVAWKEFISLVAASRVLSISAEALSVLNESSDLTSFSWVGEGPPYASWLGQSICHMASKIDPNSHGHWKAVGSLTSRALSLGYIGNFNDLLLLLNANHRPDQIVREIYSGLLVNQDLPKHFSSFLDGLRPREQIAVLESVFRSIEKKHFSDEISGLVEGDKNLSERINGVATLCSILMGNRPHLESQIADWLAIGQGASIQTIGLRRALLANFAKSRGKSCASVLGHTNISEQTLWDLYLQKALSNLAISSI